MAIWVTPKLSSLPDVGITGVADGEALVWDSSISKWVNEEIVTGITGVLTVSPNGGADYTTITAALAAAVSGDVVFVYPGTYVENLTIPDGVALVGVARSSVIVTCSTIIVGSGCAIANLTASGSVGASGKFVDIANGNVTIENVYLYPNGFSTFYAVYHAGTGTLVIRNSVLSMGAAGAGTGATAYVIYAANSALTVSITSCLLTVNYGGSWSRYSVYGTTPAIYNSSAIDPFYILPGVMSASKSMGSVIGTKGPGSNSSSQYYSLFGRISLSGLYTSGAAEFISSATGIKPTVIKGYAGQTANLTEWQDSDALVISSISAAGVGTFRPQDAGINTVVNGAIVGHNSSGTPAAGFGAGLLFQLESSTTASQDAARVSAVWSDATHATRTADIVFSTVVGAAALTEKLRLTGAGILKFSGTMGDSTLTVGTDAPADWIEVQIGADTRYIPVWAAS